MSVGALLLIGLIVVVLFLAFVLLLAWFALGPICGLAVAGPLPLVAFLEGRKRLRKVFTRSRA